MALLSARTREIHNYKKKHPDAEDGVIMSKFVVYCSDQVGSYLHVYTVLHGN